MNEGRLPKWLAKPIPPPGKGRAVRDVLEAGELETVCENASCPNLGECYSNGTATFMILGNVCTRACGFCGVRRGEPDAPREEEPAAVAEAAKKMGLGYAVVTSVTRDDLPDGGAAHFAATIGAIRTASPNCCVEVLTPDFQGRAESIETVVSAAPDVYNHNVETVPRLYSRVRGEADYERSLELLAGVKELDSRAMTKSGMMLGVGEAPDEVVAVLKDLRDVGCDAVTIGQYLKPRAGCLEVERYAAPAEFDSIARTARRLGFCAVASGPLVRSSYKASELMLGRRAAE